MQSKQTSDGHKDFSHRSVLQKLGITGLTSVAIDDSFGCLDSELADDLVKEEISTQASSNAVGVDVVLAPVGEATDVPALLLHWKSRIGPDGGIWLLTAKRSHTGYVDQRRLITAGQEAGLVDNKICSVSAATSAMRFVVPVRARPRAPSSEPRER